MYSNIWETQDSSDITSKIGMSAKPRIIMEQSSNRVLGQMDKQSAVFESPPPPQ